MKERDQLKIDVISSISDEHLGEVACERIAARRRMARRRSLFIRYGSLAAALAVIISAILPLLMLSVSTKQVPVYTGMTVSNHAPVASDAGTVFSLASRTEDNHAPMHKPTKDELRDYFGVSAGKERYYAKPNEDIYITVKLDNPEKYEILSFTLNGEKFTAYMFQPGSDLENLILKVNVGDVRGIVSYTIDAIKYVDGEKIKDVRMDGERTVNVGIYSEDPPTAAVTDYLITETSVGFTAEVGDTDGLVAATDGVVYAVIYDGERVLDSREIPIGEKSRVSFEGLTPDTDYLVSVVVTYDACDGDGYAPHLLYSMEVGTRVTILPYNLRINGDILELDYLYSNDTMSLVSVELIDWFGNTVTSSSEPVTSFTDLPSGRLTVRTTYTYTNGEESVTASAEAVCWRTEGMLPLLGGKLVAHYDPNSVYLPSPSNTFMSGHLGVDVIPTTDDISVYSMSDGTVTAINHAVSTEQNDGGFIEIIDANGLYHRYAHVGEIPLEIGDSVKVGDMLGTLHKPIELDMTQNELHVHYECYTASGHVPPPCDPEPREISEGERISKIFESSDGIIKNGKLDLSGSAGETVVYTTSFDFTYDDESVVIDLLGTSEHVTVIARDDRQYDIVCDFTGITEPVEITLRCICRVAGHGDAYRIILTLTPADPV